MIPQTEEEIEAKAFWDRLSTILAQEDTTLSEVFRNNKKPSLLEGMKRYRNEMPSQKFIDTIADYIGVTSDFILRGEAVEIPFTEIIYPEREKPIARMVKLYREATEEDWKRGTTLAERLFHTAIEDVEGIPFYAPYSVL